MGDRFYLCENKILCEYDYEERLVFANMATYNSSSLAHIRRQVSRLQVGHSMGQPCTRTHRHVTRFKLNFAKSRYIFRSNFIYLILYKYNKLRSISLPGSIFSSSRVQFSNIKHICTYIHYIRPLHAFIFIIIYLLVYY